MKEPRLTEFLLRLATDARESERFRRSKSEAREIMKKAGLSEDQIEAVLTRNSKRVQEAVIAETGDLLPAIYCGKIRMWELEVVLDDESSEKE